MKIHELADSVASRQDLARFIEALVADRRAHPDTWEHESLESYLEAMAAWANDVHPHSSRGLPTTPEWRHFAYMLLAAKIYE